MNVDFGIHSDERCKDCAGIPNSDHSFRFSSPEFQKDVHFTLKGEIERDGKPHLRP